MCLCLSDSLCVCGYCSCKNHMHDHQQFSSERPLASKPFMYQLLCSTIAVEVNICVCVHEYCIAGMLGKGKV